MLFVKLLVTVAESPRVDGGGPPVPSKASPGSGMRKLFRDAGGVGDAVAVAAGVAVRVAVAVALAL